MFFRMIYKSGQILLPFCHNPRVWQTDGQTDRILIARPRLHSMQRGKKANNHRAMWSCSIKRRRACVFGTEECLQGSCRYYQSIQPDSHQSHRATHNTVCDWRRLYCKLHNSLSTYERDTGKLRIRLVTDNVFSYIFWIHFTPTVSSTSGI